MSYLAFALASVQVVGRVEFPALAILHDDVEEAGVVVHFVDLDDVGVFKLNSTGNTKSRISHSFIYMLRSTELIFFLSDGLLTCRCI